MKKLTILILLAMAVVCRASAQNRVVTGTVSEEDGTPLTGAVVQVVGTNNAATAAIDGLYTLKNVPSGAVLRVSFLGYDPVEKKVDADRMDFILKASAQEIASVVVTGMQKMDKRIFTGATDQLLASDVKLDGISEISRVLPACPCKTFPELSAPPRKSAFAALRRSSETPSRCGWWTV